MADQPVVVVPPTPEFLAAKALYKPPDGPGPDTEAFAARILARFPDHPEAVQEALDSAVGERISDHTEQRLVTMLTAKLGVEPTWVPTATQIDMWPLDVSYPGPEDAIAVRCDLNNGRVWCSRIVTSGDLTILTLREAIREHAKTCELIERPR